MANRRAYLNWAATAAGLLALTYGLDRALNRRKNGTGWTITALAAPAALAGLRYWTSSLYDQAMR